MRRTTQPFLRLPIDPLLVLRGAIAASVLLPVLRAAAPAEAGCNVIPAAERTFRGSLGRVSRPFASPGDWVEVTLDSRCDAAVSAGFGGSTRDHVVTIAFRPTRGPRSVVVLAEDCGPVAAQLTACTGTTEQPITRRRCIQVNRPGSAPGLARTDGRTLGFRFPDTDDLVVGDTDDLTLTGPASLAVTKAGDPIACDVALSGCSRREGLLACVDNLYESDGTCGTALGGTFASFTALPPPNAYAQIWVIIYLVNPESRGRRASVHPSHSAAARSGSILCRAELLVALLVGAL